MVKIKYLWLFPSFLLSSCSQIEVSENTTINHVALHDSVKEEIQVLSDEAKPSDNPYQDDSLIRANSPKGMIRSFEEYLDMISKYPNKRLVRLSEYVLDAKIDMRYAHYENIFNKAIYSKDVAFLNIKACQALQKVQEEMLKDGFRLVIWDAYRPYSVTLLLWDIVQNSRYAATPEKGSRHNRGMAVDVSFESLDGEYIEMPTKFDECKRESSPLYNGIPKEARKNRDYLIQKMSKHGFKVLNSEWWHFDYKDCWSVPVMDISFEELDK